MNYSSLFLRSWHLIWRNKFMLMFGILIAALSGAAGENPLPRLLLDGRLPSTPLLPIPRRLAQILVLPSPEAVIRWLFIQTIDYGIPGLIALISLILIILILIGVLIVVIRGALIAAAATLDADQPITFRAAIMEGWRKAWRLILIATIPPIPITIAAIIAVLIAIGIILANGGRDFLTASADVQQRVISIIALISLALACPFGVITFLLSALSHFADRACVLEDARAIPAFRRGWDVLSVNAGSVLVLLIFQLAITAAANILLFIPRAAASFCFPLVPILWLAVGLMRAYFITLWTLAWQRWTAPNN